MTNSLAAQDNPKALHLEMGLMDSASAPWPFLGLTTAITCKHEHQQSSFFETLPLLLPLRPTAAAAAGPLPLLPLLLLKP